MSLASHRAAAAIVGACMTLSACVTSGGPVDPSTMTPTEIALRQQETERVRIVQGVATGAAVGAVLGGLAGAIVSGGDRNSIIQGALIGGVGGGVAGGVDANNVNQQTRRVAAEQGSLRETIASADKSIAHYRRSAGLASKLVGEEEARVARNNQRLRSGQITPSAYRAEMRNAGANVALVRRLASTADQDLADLNRAGAGSRDAALASRRQQLTAERDTLRRQLARIEQTYSRVPDDVALNV